MKKVGDTVTPPRDVAETAARALEWRLRHKRGGTLEAIAIARDLRDFKPIGFVKLRTIARFFQQHEPQLQGWTSQQDGFPSAERIMWDLFGGDATIRWLEDLQFRPRRVAQRKKKPESLDP